MYLSLAFNLGPALNAAGRMGMPSGSAPATGGKPGAGPKIGPVSLPTKPTPAGYGDKIFAEAEAIVTDPRAAGERVITLAREGWHPGVIGIVASRLVERFYRPVVIIAVVEGVGCGSARSIPGFNITAALEECAALLEDFGGHDQAAGLTIAPERVKELREQLNRLAGDRLQAKDLVPRCHIEAELPGHQVNMELANQLSCLEPFGVGNPVPVFGSRSWELRSWRLVGAGKNHLKLNFTREDRSLRPIFFSGAPLAPRLRRYRKLDLAFNLRAGTFREQPVLNVELKDLCYSDSSIFGRLELVDRRSEPGRINYIRELSGGGEGVALFVTTRRREEMLKRRLPPEAVTFISSGKKYRETREQVCEHLVLYDLPLHFRLLAPYFKEQGRLPRIWVHLLYSSRSREINDKLAAYLFPPGRPYNRFYRACWRPPPGSGMN